MYAMMLFMFMLRAVSAVAKSCCHVVTAPVIEQNASPV